MSGQISLQCLQPYLQRLAARESLSADEAETAFGHILNGEAAPAAAAGLLLALRARGESTAEILGAARALRRRMTTINAPENAMDIGGTGGDAAGVYNISTAAALVVAGAGVPVAKQGGRAVTSRSGAADVLEALGVRLAAPFPLLEQALRQHQFAFLAAPRHHPVMKNTAAVRGELGTKTIFNLLGPLTNPAGVRQHLVGVAERRWLLPFAEVLHSLGTRRAWVVHGRDGLDEITVTGPTDAVEISDGQIREFEIHPEEGGLFISPLEDLRGGDAATNAAALKALLAGAKNAYRNAVLLNAGAALVVAAKTATLSEGVAMARESLDSGRARSVLESVAKLTHSANVHDMS